MLVAVRRTEREGELNEEICKLLGNARRRVWQVATRHLAEHEMSMFSYQLLARAVQTGGVNQSELCELTWQHPAGISRTLDELEQSGLVQRQRDAEDRRKIRVVPTQRGHARYRRVRPAIAAAVDEALAPMSHADRLRLRALLRLLDE